MPALKVARDRLMTCLDRTETLIGMYLEVITAMALVGAVTIAVGALLDMNHWTVTHALIALSSALASWTARCMVEAGSRWMNARALR